MKKLAIFALSAAIASVAVASPEIGKPAPAFTLKDASGNEHSLADFKGKLVVLEWVNHGCPFVKKHYEPGNMQKVQAEAVADGAVWLSICSSAPGKQGHMTAEDATAKFKEVGSKATAYLLDEEGTVGKAYDAKTTPEIFIINPDGLLVYKGAIDDKPSANSADIEGAVNHVTSALKEITDGKPVTVSSTKSYGCSVKY